MRFNEFLARLLLLAALGACSVQESETAAQPPPPAQAATLPAINAWLDCVECSDADLKAVAAFGDRAVPDLRGLLLNGPSRERLESQQRHWQATYRSLKEYEQRRPERRVPLTEQEYVQRYQQKYILLNRSRAARALGAIRTTQALIALREALKTKLPPELQLDVERALKGVPEVQNPDVANPDRTNPNVKKPAPPRPPPPIVKD